MDEDKEVKVEIQKVERILNKRTKEDNVQYLIKWKNLSSWMNSWVNEKDILDPNLILNYKPKKKIRLTVSKTPLKRTETSPKKIEIDSNLISKAKRTVIVKKSSVEKKIKKQVVEEDSSDFSLDEEDSEDEIFRKKEIKKEISNDLKESSTPTLENRLIIHYQSPEAKKKRKTEPQEPWSRKQNEQLHQAIGSVPIKTKNYWNVISLEVEGKTAQQCQFHYQDRIKTPKRTKKVKSHPIVLNELQNMKGKVNKKRKMRMLLKHADSKHTDDIFSEEEQDENLMNDSLNCSFDDLQFNRTFVQHSTPENSFSESPGILRKVKMDDIDTYLNKIKSGKVGVIKQEFVKKKLEVNKKLFNEIGSGITFNDNSECSDEEEVDYYFD
eukprot:gene4577-7961_t